MRSAVHKSIDDVDAGQWNALTGTGSPFLRHEFLAALEHTGCVGRRTGWLPTYITLSDAKGIAAAAFAKAAPIAAARAATSSIGNASTSGLMRSGMTRWP